MAGTDGKARGMKEYVDEKMREIENRLGLHAKGLIKWALRVQHIERDFAEHIHHTVNQDHVSRPVLPKSDPSHPGGIGGEWRWKDNAPPAGSPPDGVIGPGYHPLPAEPPGSPTVVEAEDVKPCERCALWQPIPDSLHHEGTCGKFGRPSIEVTKADDTCGDWRTREPDQPRRECWEHRKDGEVMFWSRVQHDDPDCTQHRMVELSDGEGIAPVAMIELASRYLALQSERDNLKILNENKAKSIGRLCAQLRKEQDERIQLRARAELEALLDG